MYGYSSGGGSSLKLVVLVFATTFWLCAVPFSLTSEGRVRGRHLSVLMITMPLPGHLTPSIVLGGERVLRGHNSTLLTITVLGDDMSKGMTQMIGILQVLAGCQLLWKWWYLMRYIRKRWWKKEGWNINRMSSLKTFAEDKTRALCKFVGWWNGVL